MFESSFSRARRISALALTVLVIPFALHAQQDQERPYYTLGVGDVIKVAVWKNEELTVKTQVRPDGRISVPLLGEVDVVGSVPSELEASLSERYKEFITAPSVSVVVEEINSMKVFVTGKVDTPGAYDILRPTRMLQALAMAGGVTAFAEDKVVVLRELGGGKQQRIEVSRKAITSGKRTEDNLVLKAGDTIVVP